MIDFTQLTSNSIPPKIEMPASLSADAKYIFSVTYTDPDAMQLEDEGSPEMHVIEVEDDAMIKTCELHDYKYTVISTNDIVIPPSDKHDFV